MDWFQALILGIVEGLTEYLPVSSTGHLILVQRALGIDDTAASKAYAICIQSGAILAVLGVFTRHVTRMVRGLVGKDEQGLRLALLLVVAFVPTGVVAVLTKKKIDQYLLHLWPITFAWFVGGVAILAFGLWQRSGRGRLGTKTVFDLTWSGAFAIGCVQCLGLWPGVSRSLVTILGGLAVGLGMTAALEFSFLLGVVTLSAATVYEAAKHGREMLTAYETGPLVIGFVAAAVSAAVAVSGMIRYLRGRGMDVFGYYRIVLAMVIATLLLTGQLTETAVPPRPEGPLARALPPVAAVAESPLSK
jgi:undecaprenyl-diphosphatase